MIFWIRLFVLSLLIALHLSVVQIFSSSDVPPVILINSALVWTLLLGFPRSLLPLSFLVIATQSILFGSIELFSLYFVLVAYVTSFMMKRTLIGNGTWLNFLVLACFSMIGSIGFSVFEEFLYAMYHGKNIFTMFSVLSSGHIFFGGLMSFILFPLVFFLLNSSERIIRDIRQATQSIVK